MDNEPSVMSDYAAIQSIHPALRILSSLVSAATFLPRSGHAVIRTALSLILPYSVLPPPKHQWDLNPDRLFEGFYTRVESGAWS